MRLLSPQAFERARQFVDSKARPLDRALCALALDGGDGAAVMSALAAYQRADGGLGHALEPDFRLQASSVLATTVGPQYAAAVGADGSHPVVAKALAYLVSSWNEAARRWPAVPPSVNTAPHAPWRHVDEATGRCSVEGTWANPSAEVVAYL